MTKGSLLKIITDRAEYPLLNPIKGLLYLLSLVNYLIQQTRIPLYHNSLLRTKTLGCKVISIGNITMGGTGKTPTVKMIANMLKNKGFKVAVLSRGYKGRSKERINLVSDGDKILLRPPYIGEEAYMLAKGLKGIPILTGKDRYLIGRYAEDRFRIDVAILDDGYQHIRLHRNLNILLIDTTNPFGNNLLFPRGILREPLSNMDRADIVLMTRCHNNNTKDRDLSNIGERLKRDIPIFRSRDVAIRCIDLNSCEERDIGILRDKKILAFCGIGSPQSFRDIIMKVGGNIVRFLTYPDHHRYSDSDIRDIKEMGRDVEMILTTEKDGSALLDHLPLSFPLWGLKIDMEIIEKRDEWEKMIVEFIRRTPHER